MHDLQACFIDENVIPLVSLSRLTWTQPDMSSTWIIKLMRLYMK